MRRRLRPALLAVLTLATVGTAGPALAQTAGPDPAAAPVVCTNRWQDRSPARADILATAPIRSGPSTICLQVGRGPAAVGVDCWTATVGGPIWWHVTTVSGLVRGGWVQSRSLAPAPAPTVATRCLV